MNFLFATSGRMSRNVAIYGLKGRIREIPIHLCHLLSFFNRLLSYFVNAETERSNKKGLIGGRNGLSRNWHED